jgi:rhamnosyltransferase
LNIQVIIPVYKPDKKLIKLIERLKNQTLTPHGINLIHSAGDEPDETVELVKKEFPDIRIMEIRVSEYDHGDTRRRAVRNTPCDIFVMMTQDAVPVSDDLIEKLVTPLKNQMEKEEADNPGSHAGAIACVFARQMPGTGSSPYEKLARLHNYSELSKTKYKSDIEKMGIKAFFCSDVCCAYRRDIYEEAGGFIKSTIFNEDMIIARKFLELGYGIRYEATAKVIHAHNYTAKQQFKRNFDLGVSQAMHPEVFADVSSESEGFKFVGGSIKLLMKKRAFLLIPGFITQCAFKLAGFKLGRNYEKLPECFIMKFTANKKYWLKMKESN